MNLMRYFSLALLLLVLSSGTLAQIPRLISYQGMLMGTNQQPVPDGQYAITFKLYDATSTSLWTETHNQVTVSKGMFSVALGSVSPLSIYFDKPYFLGIQVGSDPEMQPRIALTSAAYAIRAEDADKLMGYYASGTPQPNKLLPLDATGKFPASAIPSGGGGGDYLMKNTTDTTRSTSTSPLLLVSNLGSGDGLDARSGSGVGMAGRSTSGDGVTGWTGASDKSGVFGNCTDGVGVKGRSDNNDGVVGWTGGAAKSGVFGHTSTSGSYGVTGLAGTGGVGVWGSNNVAGTSAKLGTDTHGIDVTGLGRFVLPSGQISVSTPGGWPGIIGLSDNGHRRDIIVWNSGISFEVSTSSSAPPAGNGITVLENGYVGVGTTAPDEMLRVMGAVKCTELKLTGGSDIAEPFDLCGSEVLAPGTVMSIDVDTPGKVRVSSTAYDRSVAGVISGAGGIKPGMLMSQSGTVADGAFPIALTGRVYCLADASNGPIRPGDLLTTSGTRGHAMKVTDYARAQGAILGKAMSGLEHGSGLVLILVALQ